MCLEICMHTTSSSVRVYLIHKLVISTSRWASLLFLYCVWNLWNASTPWQKATSSDLLPVLSCFLRKACACMNPTALICHFKFRLSSFCTYTALWKETFEAAPWQQCQQLGGPAGRRGRRWWRDLKRCEWHQDAQPTTWHQNAVPVRFMIVLRRGPNDFCVSPWAISPENVSAGCLFLFGWHALPLCTHARKVENAHGS